MKGVILAAGRGTRLFPVTSYIPKPLLPLAGKMTLEYAFDQLKKMGVTEICIVVGSIGDQIKQALGDGHRFGVKLTYVFQTEQKGIADALLYTKDFLGNDSFVLYLGDAIYSGDLAQYANRFQRLECANLSVVKPVEDPSRFGVAVLSGSRIVLLEEKPKKPKSNLAMAGLYFFTQKIWDVLPNLKPSYRGEYEITDAIQMLIDSGEQVEAGIFEGDWFDTGTLDSFLDASSYLTGNQKLISSSAILQGSAEGHVVIGEDAVVSCTQIEDSVVLPGAEIVVEGPIRHSILGGKVKSVAAIQSEILYGN